MWEWIKSFLSDFAAEIAVLVVTSIFGAILLWYRRIRGKYKFALRLSEMGISNIFADRNDYARYRGTPDLPSYVSSAKRRIVIVGHWMAQGTEIQGVAEAIANLVKSPKRISVDIALVNPRGTNIPSFANYLGLSENETIFRVEQSLSKLNQARLTLSDEEKGRMRLFVYDTFPVASVVMLDPDEVDGRIQVDMKLFKQSRQNSFSFEVQGDTPLYRRIRDSWYGVIQNAQQFDPITLTTTMNALCPADLTEQEPRRSQGHTVD